MKVYIHVPFCHSKCAYCDFYSTPHSRLMEAYVNAAGNEWGQVSREYIHETTDREADTIYIGGGTPSSLPTTLLDTLIAHIPKSRELTEFTIEANPDDVTDEWAGHITGHTAINRVSMGFQTFDDDILRFIGRRHTSAQSVRAFDTLRSHGVGNISCDLIYGLPGQTLRGWRTDIDRLLSMRPEHISAYLLSYEPHTRLGVMLEKRRVAEASDELAGQMYDYLCDVTRDAGYEHYEISNFALPGSRAIHNSSYWDGSSYIGLGPGAHSMVGGLRWFNPTNLREYIAHQGLDVRVIEEEDSKNRFNDTLITSLRTSRGLNPVQIPEEFTHNFTANSTPLLNEGLLIMTSEGNIAIPETHWLTSNSILLQLIEV